MTDIRVCKDWFPNEKNPERSGFLIDEQLKMQIDVLLLNILKDWDFTIIISGQGEVRVGKSKLAMDIATYWCYELQRRYKINVPFNLETNYVFDGKELIKKGNYLGTNFKYSPLIYDEAGADLEGRKVVQTLTQDVLDFFRECGQYNLLNILVLPEYFDLPKGIALTRSIFLIDVYYTSDSTGHFIRGYFNFFSKRQKKWLYLKGKKELNYSAVKYDFNGRFYDFWQLDKVEYNKKKQEALKKRESKARNKFQLQRDACWYLLCIEGLEDEKGNVIRIRQKDLAIRMEQMTGIFVAPQTMSDGIKHYASEEELKALEKINSASGD